MCCMFSFYEYHNHKLSHIFTLKPFNVSCWSRSPDVVVHVAQRRHELEGLWELHNLWQKEVNHLNCLQWQIRWFKNKQTPECIGPSPASQCPPGGARSSAHTAARSVLAAWSSSRSSPGRSAPQKGRWPPQAKPVASQETRMTFVPWRNPSLAALHQESFFLKSF